VVRNPFDAGEQAIIWGEALYLSSLGVLRFMQTAATASQLEGGQRLNLVGKFAQRLHDPCVLSLRLALELVERNHVGHRVSSEARTRRTRVRAIGAS